MAYNNLNIPFPVLPPYKSSVILILFCFVSGIYFLLFFDVNTNIFFLSQNILSDFRARGGRIKAAADGTCHHDTPKESSKKTKDSEQKNDTNYVSMYYEPKVSSLYIYIYILNI